MASDNPDVAPIRDEEAEASIAEACLNPLY